MSPKRPQHDGFTRLADLRVVGCDGFKMLIERWFHPATWSTVCSSVDVVDDVPTYHVSIDGVRVAEVLRAFEMERADEINEPGVRAHHFWLAVAS